MSTWIKVSLIFCGLVSGCTSVDSSAGKGHADAIEKVAELRSGMSRSQVHEVLKPIREFPGLNISGIESTFYWLSSDCGLWLEYTPGDKLIRFDTVEVGVIDHKTKR